MKMCCYIVLAYNNVEDTMITVKGILDQQCEFTIDIVVIDNHSDQKFAKLLSESLKRYPVTYVYREVNDGYSGGNNWAWKEYRKKYRYLFFVNNDLVFLSKTVTQNLVNIFEQNLNIGLAGPIVLSGKNEKQQDSFLFQFLFRKEIFGHKLEKKELYEECPSIVGCFLAVDTNTYKKDELFDSSFFMYGEEFELALKVWKGKKSVVRIADEKEAVYHKGGKDPFGKNVQAWKCYLTSRNLAICIKYFYPLKKLEYMMLLLLSGLKRIVKGPGTLEDRLISVVGCINGLRFGLCNYDKESILNDAKKHLKMK